MGVADEQFERESLIKGFDVETKIELINLLKQQSKILFQNVLLLIPTLEKLESGVYTNEKKTFSLEVSENFNRKKITIKRYTDKNGFLNLERFFVLTVDFLQCSVEVYSLTEDPRNTILNPALRNVVNDAVNTWLVEFLKDSPVWTKCGIGRVLY